MLFDSTTFVQMQSGMNQEEQIKELYSVVFKLINGFEDLKKTNARLIEINILLTRENQELKQELEKYRSFSEFCKISSVISS